MMLLLAEMPCGNKFSFEEEKDEKSKDPEPGKKGRRNPADHLLRQCKEPYCKCYRCGYRLDCKQCKCSGFILYESCRHCKERGGGRLPAIPDYWDCRCDVLWHMAGIPYGSKQKQQQA